MGYGTPDPYYQPEAFDLKIILSEDRPDMSYEFDMFTIWEHTPTGDIYWAQDSGCSCPSPFENYTKLEDLKTGTLDQAYREMSEWRLTWQSASNG